jgi:hypothetical protein
VVTCAGGFRVATEEAYGALPEWLTFGSHSRHSFELVWRGWSGRGAKVRGWGELAKILLQNNVITRVPPPAHYTLGRTRYALAESVPTS